jgi:Family of unknown function (DUF6527)
MKFKLQRVRYMPKELQPGVLYVSKEFGTAAHLCACGCGTKVRTPLGPTEWAVKNTRGGPSLWPSVGNWQQDCQSHYVIRCGEVVWCKKWSAKQIAAGRAAEQRRRKAYYEDRERARKWPFAKLWSWIKYLFKR